PAILQLFLEGIGARTGGKRILAAGVGDYPGVLAIDQNGPARQSLVAGILEAVAVVVLKLAAGDQEVVEVAERVTRSVDPDGGRDPFAALRDAVRPAILQLFLEGIGAR